MSVYVHCEARREAPVPRSCENVLLRQRQVWNKVNFLLICVSNMYADEKHSYPLILWANITSSWANMRRQNELYMIEGSSSWLHIGQTLSAIYCTYALQCTLSMLQPPSFHKCTHTFLNKHRKVFTEGLSSCKEIIWVETKVRVINRRRIFVLWRKKTKKQTHLHTTKLSLRPNAC